MQRKKRNKRKIVNMKNMEIMITNYMYRHGHFINLSIPIK